MKINNNFPIPVVDPTRTGIFEIIAGAIRMTIARLAFGVFGVPLLGLMLVFYRAVLLITILVVGFFVVGGFIYDPPYTGWSPKAALRHEVNFVYMGGSMVGTVVYDAVAAIGWGGCTRPHHHDHDPEPIWLTENEKAVKQREAWLVAQLPQIHREVEQTLRARGHSTRYVRAMQKGFGYVDTWWLLAQPTNPKDAWTRDRWWGITAPPADKPQTKADWWQCFGRMQSSFEKEIDDAAWAARMRIFDKVNETLPFPEHSPAERHAERLRLWNQEVAQNDLAPESAPDWAEMLKAEELSRERQLNAKNEEAAQRRRAASNATFSVEIQAVYSALPMDSPLRSEVHTIQFGDSDALYKFEQKAGLSFTCFPWEDYAGWHSWCRKNRLPGETGFARPVPVGSSKPEELTSAEAESRAVGQAIEAKTVGIYQPSKR